MIPPSAPSSHYEHVHAQTFVGRDVNLNLEIRATGEELQAVLDRLLPLLRERDVTVQDGVISARDGTLEISPAQADALGQFLAALAVDDPAERERHYLTYLVVNPAFRRWSSLYVPLSGGYRPVPEITPTYSKILVRGEGPQRQIERVRLEDIRQALDEHPSFVLLAPPGAGKTTVLQRLTLDLALQRLQDGSRARLPLFVRLAAQRPDEDPHAFLARMWQQEMPGRHADPQAEFLQALRSGQLCLLCDALNEARREGYLDRVQQWQDFARDLPTGNRLVFTCRTQDYFGELGVQQVEIDPLSDAQIQAFLTNYLGPDPAEQLWDQLQGPYQTLLPLARIPYYLWLMVQAFQEAGDLPRHRAHLFAGFVERLFRREQTKHHPDWIDPAAQHLALGQLAYAMQELGEGTEVEEAWAREQLPQEVTVDGKRVPTSPDTVLRLARAASFFAVTGPTTLKFTHHLMQEYFAGEELLRRHQDGEDLATLWQVPSRVGEMPKAERGKWDPLPEPPTTGWEQTTILAAGLDPGLIDTVQRVNPALAARCLLELGQDANPAQVDRSRQALLDRLGNVAIHLRSRMEAGLLLGRLGDPRFPVETVKGVKVILPPLVKIPGGRATIGSAWWDWLADKNEKPRHPVTLAPYAMGRYPVTNAEYACFMAAGGYQEERYWSAGGRHWRKGEPVPGEEDPVEWWIRTWKRRKEDPREIDRRVRRGWLTERDADNWRRYITWPEETFVEAVRKMYPEGKPVQEPRFWDDHTFNNPSQPVVGVCWYEAVAYANWLTEVTGLAFRLPTEPEWEWAARASRRRYPWGWRWDVARLNSLEGRVMHTTPVGIYPQGATPDGIHDLAGNVWEWTATRVAGYPYDPKADLEDPDATGRRIVRGGGWTAVRRMVRCAYRDGINPRSWNHDGGFRLARTLSP